MIERQTLEAYLGMDDCAPHLRAVCDKVLAIAGAGWKIAKILARGPLAGNLSAIVGESLDRDGQDKLDVATRAILRDALIGAPVAVFASKAANQPEILNLGAELAVSVDPLDGSSNIDTLTPIGQTALVFSLGAGTQMFTLDPATPVFMTTKTAVAIPSTTLEDAINSSNFIIGAGR